MRFGAGLPNLRHLNAVVAVAQSGSLSAGAEAVGLSQPALSQALAHLELRFGARLFTRSPQGMLPTPPGEAVMIRVELAQRHLDRAVAAVGARRHLARLLSLTQLCALCATVEHGGFRAAEPDDRFRWWDTFSSRGRPSRRPSHPPT